MRAGSLADAVLLSRQALLEAEASIRSGSPAAWKPLPERWSERRDYDTLGDHALYFGDGYMIHGTLYQRYLGRSITHGCVRLGDADLKRVYELTPVGARIYIF